MHTQGLTLVLSSSQPFLQKLYLSSSRGKRGKRTKKTIEMGQAHTFLISNVELTFPVWKCNPIYRDDGISGCREDWRALGSTVPAAEKELRVVSSQ